MNYTMTVIKAFNIACNAMNYYEVKELLLDEYTETLDIDGMTTWEWVETATEFVEWVEKVFPYVANFGDVLALISIGEWRNVKEITEYAIEHMKFRAVAVTDDTMKIIDRLFAYEVTYDSKMTKFIKIKTIPKKQ